MERCVNWGILGCGGIAKKFVESSLVVATANVVAVASMSKGRAESFAKEHRIITHYDSYDNLLNDSNVEAVYVANTHNFHHETVIKVLEAGKAVLCEKPLAVNAQQAMEMIALARRKNLFLMEGMWTRFLPAVVQARKWIEVGRIGTPRKVYASFGLDCSFPPEHRMVNPDLAGGVLLDLGIYPLSIASMVSGGSSPTSIHGISEKGETGVDIDDSVLVTYGDGLAAHLDFGIKCHLQNTAVIQGDKGSITLPSLFIAADSVKLKTDSENIEKTYPIAENQAFCYEIEAVTRCIIDGKTECPAMPLDETLILAQTMDALRRQWGLRYNGE